MSIILRENRSTSLQLRLFFFGRRIEGILKTTTKRNMNSIRPEFSLLFKRPNKITQKECVVEAFTRTGGPLFKEIM